MVQKQKILKVYYKHFQLISKALIVTADLDENVALSGRNIPGVTIVTADGINVLDVLNHDKLILTKAAVEKVEEVLA